MANRPEELARLHHWANCLIMDAIQYQQVDNCYTVTSFDNLMH